MDVIDEGKANRHVAVTSKCGGDVYAVMRSTAVSTLCAGQLGDEDVGAGSSEQRAGRPRALCHVRVDPGPCAAV